MRTWVLEIRSELPRIGSRKLYHLLKPKMEKHQIKLGRDKFFAFMKKEGLLAHLRRKYTKTTFSHHWLKKHPNLIKGLNITKPEQVWVADITYVKTMEGYCYLHLITDAYSRQIMGYCFSDSLATECSLKALSKALSKRKFTSKLIHHSDRGIQYCSYAYINMLAKNNILASMTENSDPYENAIAERVNGILKQEFYLDEDFNTKQTATMAVDQAINLYNYKRPHLKLNFKTPNQVHNLVSEAVNLF